jgi:phosphohistidine swiveling domain-containing protein
MEETVCLPALGSAAFTDEAGGRKAAPLHELIRQGFPVPPGFVVPPDLALDTRFERECGPAIVALGGFPVAARSSGHLEDLPGASFAGQYVTRLEIADPSALARAIDECRQSAKSPQVTSYLRRNGLDDSKAHVSVLVQAMVDAAIAGVAFSIHPTSGREDHALLECCHGLGEKLVSGQTAPTRYVVQLEDAAIVERQPGEEDVQLDDRIVKELCGHLLELQALFGTPQDVEWAVDHEGTLWILQSRPITRVQWRSDIEEYTTADFREGGVAARVCTPLMYALYRDAMQRSMQQYFVDIKLMSAEAQQQTWIGMFYGRPYWSASAVKKWLLKVPGFDEEVFDKDLGIQKKYGEGGPARTPTSIRTVLPAIPVAIALERNYRQHLRVTEGYGARFRPREAQLLKTADSFGALTDDAFFAAFDEVLAFHLQTECDYFTTIYNNANFQSDLKKLLKKIGDATGEPPSAVDLMAGLQDIGHMNVQRGFVRLVKVAKREGITSPQWRRAQEDFLAEHYFHGDAELDISVPRWGEHPARVQQIVEDIVRSGIDPKDPDEAAGAQGAQFAAAEQRIRAALRRSFWLRVRFDGSFRRQLHRARLYLSRREEMREYSTRAYNVVRRFALEAGQRLHRLGYLTDAADVLMLYTEDIVACARSAEDRARVRERVRFRRLMYRGYRVLEPPGELGRGVTQQTSSHQADASGALVLKGIGCSAGIVTGQVRVVPALELADTLKPAEILVTRFTDPGWTPVLGLVSGIVTEVGGLLSHAAVIGREYGIPAVLNVPGAMRVLKTGQRVEIDGTEGTVRILDGENASHP